MKNKKYFWIATLVLTLALTFIYQYEFGLTQSKLERSGIIYDPSYGYSKNASIIKYEDENIEVPSGNLIIIFDSSSNTEEFYPWIGVKDNPSTLEVIN